LTRRLRVLSLGFTRELWEEDGGAAGDTLDRLSAYSEHLDAYHVVVHALRRHGLDTPRRLTPTLWAHATNGGGPLGSWVRMLRLGHRLARENSFDLVQSQDPFFTGTVGHILSRRLGLPHNVCVYGADPFDPHWIAESARTRLATPVARAVLRAADGIQVDGLRTRARLAAAGLSAGRIRVKPMVPVDLDVFLGALPDPAVRSDLSAGGRFDRLLLFVGRLVPQKDVSLLLEAVAGLASRHMGLRLICVGDGPEAPALRERARRMGLDDRVWWVGARSRPDIARFMAAADVVVLPSRYEGYARVLMEAAAAGRPIACTDVGGVEEAVRDGETGMVVPVGDARALQAALDALLGDPYRARRMGEAGRAGMREFAAAQASPSRQVEIWQALVGGARAAGPVQLPR
jgi:glycosyltransferase involved in cell wall biosynthesis